MRRESSLPPTGLHRSGEHERAEQADPALILQNRLARTLLDLDHRTWRTSQENPTQMVCEFAITELIPVVNKLTVVDPLTHDDQHTAAGKIASAAHKIFGQLGIAEDGVKIETLPPGNRWQPDRIRCTLPKEVFNAKAGDIRALHVQALKTAVGTGAVR